jgi:hypothetical protein
LRTAAIAVDPGTVVRCEKHAEQLTSNGFTVLCAEDFGDLGTDPALTDLYRDWNDLPLDEAMPPGATYRRRRFGRLGVEVSDSGLHLDPLPHAAFRQAADIIPLHGGRARVFAPVSPPTLLAPALRALVAFDVMLATAVSGIRAWLVNVHLIRIVTTAGLAGEPTPEGRHRDGHLYVGMHLFGRTGCAGGESYIYADETRVAALTMAAPLDSLVVDDRRVTHEVTPITPLDGQGVRDMLLVDLNEA